MKTVVNLKYTDVFRVYLDQESTKLIIPYKN